MRVRRDYSAVHSENIQMFFFQPYAKELYFSTSFCTPCPKPSAVWVWGKWLRMCCDLCSGGWIHPVLFYNRESKKMINSCCVSNTTPFTTSHHRYSRYSMTPDHISAGHSSSSCWKNKQNIYKTIFTYSSYTYQIQHIPSVYSCCVSQLQNKKISVFSIWGSSCVYFLVFGQISAKWQP